MPSWNRIIYGASRRGSATGPHPGRSVRWDSLRMGIPKAILDHRFWWVVDLFLWKMIDFVKWFFIVQFPIWMESYNPSMVQTTKRVSIFVALILWFFPGKKNNRFESIPNDLGYKYIKLHLWNIMYSTIVYSRIIYTKKIIRDLWWSMYVVPGTQMTWSWFFLVHKASIWRPSVALKNALWPFPFKRSPISHDLNGKIDGFRLRNLPFKPIHWNLAIVIRSYQIPIPRILLINILQMSSVCVKNAPLSFH